MLVNTPGDNDGLGLLWIPFLVIICFVLFLPAGMAEWLRKRLRSSSSSDGPTGEGLDRTR